jgi:pyruvate dehydrogenase E1 component alpha subunit
MQRLVERVRAGQGPAFMLCHTYRFRGHHVGDINRAYYRSKEEETYWKTEQDPLKILSGWLIDQKLAEAPIFDQIQTDTDNEIEAAVKFALDAPYPHAREVDQHVYA